MIAGRDLHITPTNQSETVAEATTLSILRATTATAANGTLTKLKRVRIAIDIRKRARATPRISSGPELAARAFTHFADPCGL
jgi:hypothetical protein